MPIVGALEHLPVASQNCDILLSPAAKALESRKPAWQREARSGLFCAGIDKVGQTIEHLR